MQLSEQLYNKLDQASKDWAEAEQKLIIMEEGKKAKFSELVLKHKKLVKTVGEAEHEARCDEEYKKVIENYSTASMNLIKARYHYNNIDKYVSLKQSELKRDLALNSKV